MGKEHDPKQERSPEEQESSKTLEASYMPGNDLVPLFRDFPEQWKALIELTKQSEVAFKLPEKLDQRVVETIRGGGVQLISGILKDPSLVRSIIATKIFRDEADLSEALNKVAFGQPNDFTIEQVRRVTETFQAGCEESHIVEVAADLMLDKRVNAKGFMEVTDELLRTVNPMLAENLENLFAHNRDSQVRSMKWLFDTMIEHCEQAISTRVNQKKNLLTARIIFKQLSKVLSEKAVKKGGNQWLGLQTIIVMRFAERMKDEHAFTKKPLVAFLMAIEPKMAIDFFLAVDTNFNTIGQEFNRTDKKTSEEIRRHIHPYGGYESYAQGIETILSFGVMGFPDQMYQYLYSRFPDVAPLMQAQYLNCMKYAVYDTSRDDGAVFHQNRCEFLLDALLPLAAHPYSFARDRLHDLLVYIPQYPAPLLADAMIERLSGGCYEELSQAQRSFFTEFHLRLAKTTQVENAVEKVLPFIDYELQQERNLEIQGKIFWADYFAPEVQARLTDEQAQRLRECIINGYDDFSDNDVLADKLLGIMVYYKVQAVTETYEGFVQHNSSDVERAIGLLHFSARIAHTLDVTLTPTEQQQFDSIVSRAARLGREVSIAKQKLILDYYDLRSRVSDMHRELEGIEQHKETVTSTARVINSKVEELDMEKRDLEGERSRRYQEQRDNASGVDSSQSAEKEIWNEFVDKVKGFFSRAKRESESSGQSLVQILRSLKETKVVTAGYMKESVQARARIKAIEKRLEEMKPEYAEVLAEQAAMVEAVRELSVKHEKLTKFEKESEKQLDTLLGNVKKIMRRADQFYEALLCFQQSRILSEAAFAFISRALDTSGEQIGRKQKQAIKDGHALLSRLRMEEDPAGRRRAARTLAEYMRTEQLKRGIYQPEVLRTVQCFTELVESGEGVPQEKGDSIFSVISEAVRAGRFEQDTIGRQGIIAASLAKERQRHTMFVQKDIKQLITLLGAGSPNLLPPLQEFLRTKFGEPGERGETDTVEILIRFFAIVASERSVEAAFDNLFFMLSGQGGQFFVQPTESDTVAVNRGQQVDKYYGRYFKSIRRLQSRVRQYNQESFRLQEGSSWNEEVNNAAASYLSAVFCSSATPQAIRQEAERILVLLLFDPWTKSVEQEERKSEQREAEDLKILLEAVGFETPKVDDLADVERLAFSEYAIVAAIRSYLKESPTVSLTQYLTRESSPYIGTHKISYLIDLSYMLAKKTIVHFNHLLPSSLPILLETLEGMHPKIDEDIQKDDGSDEVPVLGLIETAIAQLREHLGESEPDFFSQMRLPSNSNRYRLENRPRDSGNER